MDKIILAAQVLSTFGIPAFIRWFVKSTFTDYFGAYNKEKAKNLATKEDIGEITKLVEEVKKTFAQETEVLKATLQISSNLRISLANEQRNAIVDFKISHDRWVNILSDKSKFLNLDAFKDLDAVRSDIDSAYIEVRDKKSKLLLFVDNEEIVKSAENLFTLTLKNLQPRVERVISDLYDNLITNLEVSSHGMSQDEFIANSQHENRILLATLNPFYVDLEIEMTKILNENATFQKLVQAFFKQV